MTSKPIRLSLVRFTLVAVCGLIATTANAHFKLLEPASWIEEDDRGDPQKLGPCGGTIDNPGVRTGTVSDVEGGSMLRVIVDETIYHPGHFRIALARRPNWLPEDPVATMQDSERGPRSDRAAIAEDGQAPIIVDGLWEHYERFTGIRETEIRIPNIDCEGCFLQVIQFMSEHPGFREGGFSYHHCAVLNIAADASLPVDEGW